MSWTLVLHGGCGTITPATISAAQDQGARAALGQALEAGAAVLAGGGAALDAVEAAVRVLEDDPHFNAGRGAALTRDGLAELDAAIMDGTRRAGAVAGVTATRHPVSLARAVMEHSPHVLLAGAGADAFARTQRVATATQEWLVLPERRAQLAAMLADRGSGNAGGFDVDMKFGTVGAVARDTHGHLAAATSTGGVTGKSWGRIGDSPLIGAGTWADDRAGAVSCTGSGEVFVRVGAAAEICARARLAGQPLEAAVDGVLAEVRAMGGTGGVIVVGPAGEAVWRFTTLGMYRAKIDSTGDRAIAVFGDE